MAGSFRQTADSLHQFFPTQSPGFLHAFSLHQFCECRTASHSGNASFGKKTDFLHMAVRNFHAQFQNVAASWIFDLRGCVRIDDLARVARMLEVIEKLRRIHCENCNLPAIWEVRLWTADKFIPLSFREAQRRGNLGSCRPREEPRALALLAG